MTLRELARAVTAIEDRLPHAESLLREVFSRTGHALAVGITGPAGAGKSTFTDYLIALLRSEGLRVAVLAVDPSSPFSGGAILGDRIRMQRHHADPGVFIRSVATRGNLGGLSAAIGDLSLLLDAAGFDVVLIETIGVGQDEVDIARIAEVTVVLLAPGMGDDVQAIKAGIMEVADVFVLNKADQPGIDKLEAEVQFVLGLSTGMDAPIPPIVRCVSSEAKGIGDAWQAIRRTVEGNRGKDRKVRAWELRLRDMFRERAAAFIRDDEVAASALAVQERQIDPYTVVEEWLARDHREHASRLTIDHLGIAVKSIDEALKFYRDTLRVPLSLRETIGPEKVHAAMLPTGESRIELLEATDDDSAIAKFIAKRGEGLHHVALKVRDFEGIIERLKASGARIVNEPRAGAGGHRYVFVHPASTGGVLLELIQDKEH